MSCQIGPFYGDQFCNSTQCTNVMLAMWLICTNKFALSLSRSTELCSQHLKMCVHVHNCCTLIGIRVDSGNVDPSANMDP